MSLLIREQFAAEAAEGRIAAEIRQYGFCRPIPLLTQAECAALERHASRTDLPAPLSWFKGRAATDPVFHELAARPEIIAALRPLLSEDIVLWGASIVYREPGSIHPWHTDMESADPTARVISAWVGICNASESSGLRLIAGSHRFGRSVQEVLLSLGEDRDTITDVRMAEIARAIDPTADIVETGSRDGDMVLFDGRVWHSGYNDRGTGSRVALLLQYAAAETPIPMPAGPGYEWPLRFTDRPRVPTVLVSGTARHSANRIVPAPPHPLKGTPKLTTVAKSVSLPLAEDPVKRWQPYPQFHGRSGGLATMACHISVLSPGHHPHSPHIHPEEELLLVLDGAVEIELADGPDGAGSRRHQLRPGMFSYYPATQHHTIHNTAASPATYLMFKWHGGAADTEAPLPAHIVEYDAAILAAEPKPIVHTPLFEHATHSLNKLRAHVTVLQPNAGYEAHADPYDVAIVLLSGEVETVGAQVRPLGLIYYSAGELHGMKNVGNSAATYLVFEFHSPSNAAPEIPAPKKRRKHGIRKVFRKIVKAIRKLRQHASRSAD